MCQSKPPGPPKVTNPPAAPPQLVTSPKRKRALAANGGSGVADRGALRVGLAFTGGSASGLRI